ncbi:MAG: hypothetical protein HUJ98_03075 [Bacteroidaceae bacterium]|nr:hypothetical protein [Bacteroidaceae bacterium]
MKKFIGIILVALAVCYIIMPYDLDKAHKFLGYTDDFFVFMAAFVYCYSCFQKPERYYIRRTLKQISLACILLAAFSLFAIAILF